MLDARLSEVIVAKGHENIQATHETTLEITMEEHLSERGDCIVAVGASKAGVDLNAKFREALRKRNARLTILIEAGGVTERVNAHGSPRLILTHPTDLVVRKSDYVCSRTLAVRSDKAAKHLSRELVEKLKNPKEKAKITLTVSF
jgi:hypothetical protein